MARPATGRRSRTTSSGPSGPAPTITCSPCMDIIAHPTPHRAQASAPGRVRVFDLVARARVSPRPGTVGAP